ncbi:MAG: glycoside hydrolase family 55 protein [Firmicutes bacterium]|nr:glycoside hydrolase family 55 protein [Bacillota bacterium]
MIDREIKLTSDLAIAQGVSLIFKGGSFTSDVPVTIHAPELAIENETNPATGVTIEAPLSMIFGKNISVKGYWITKFTCPLWFEPTIRRHHYQQRDVYDYADCINKAIEMCCCGEVYLPKGDYFISKPIMLPHGVTLRGDAGQLYDHKSTHIFILGTSIPDNNSETETDGHADFTPTKENPLRFDYDYTIYVNCKRDLIPIQINTDPWIALKGITLINYPKVHKTSKCVYAAFGGSFDRVIWYDYVQAVIYSNNYADAKQITNCVAHYDSQFNESQYNDAKDTPYLFQLQGLGDAFVFTGNHISSPFNKALSIINCGGGSIQSNIINSDVYIEGSKAITYLDNHMELGAQVYLYSSCVSITDLYIEKGTRPSIIVKSDIANEGTQNEQPALSRCIVSMNNIQFSYYNSKRFDNETFEEKRKRLDSINEYDILIDENALITMNNVFRYDLIVGFGSVVPYGVKILTRQGPFTRFNNLSYYLSGNCRILQNYAIQGNYSIDSPNSPRAYHIQEGEWVNWFRPTGTYKYLYQIIWDADRELKRVSDDGHYMFQLPDSHTTLNIPFNAKGVLIAINAQQVGGSLMLRLYRQCVSTTAITPFSEWETVDVPLCGAIHLYDNGISICGYKWKACLTPGELTGSISKSTFIRFNATSVTAWLEKRPSNLSKWQAGDIVYLTDGPVIN